MTHSKDAIRKQALEARKSLSDAEFRKRNNLLVEQIQVLVVKEDVKTIHTFLPIVKNREPDMTSLFKEWWDSGRRIMVSKTDFKLKKMSHYWMTQSTELVTNSWGIPEPVGAEAADFEEVELLIVPLLVGDKQGNRIGYGGGYYDKLLKAFRGHSVGVSLFAKVDRLDLDPWDIPIDVILTA